MKKILAVLLSLALLCACVPLGAIPVVAATSGTTGDCTWVLDGTHLTISGNGAMGEYEWECGPWGSAVTSVIIEDGVTAIGPYAFFHCKSLQSVTIPDSVKIIEIAAFNTCASLESIEIGGNVIAIETGAFFDCDSLRSVTISNGVKTIGSSSFAFCDSITTVTIPDSVTSIGEQAFILCDSLMAINVSSDNAHYCSEDGVLFNKDKTTLIRYPDDKSGAYAIPDGVTSLAEWAIYGCGALESVTLPISVTSVGKFAFDFCDSLTDVYYGGTESDRAAMVFGDNNEPLLDATWHYKSINPKDHYSKIVAHSVTNMNEGNGLAFRFELSAAVNVKGKNKVDYKGATIQYLGQTCNLLGMGCVMTNDDRVGQTNYTLNDVNEQTVLDIPVVFLLEHGAESCAFAFRIVNIPSMQLEHTIYARPYYIVEVDGQPVTVYGNIDTASCREYMK